MAKKFDFCGWATRANVKCADGRTILKDAFADQDGMVVPLVWNHQHDGVENVLGHALLQRRPEGMYAYCEFNDSDNARAAKEAVRHGDVGSLSIWANKLVESANGVAHGIIREVSLVLAGANPEARIESFMEHSGFDDDIEAFIYTTGNTGLSLEHSDEEDDDEKKKKESSDESKDKEPEDESKEDDGDSTTDDEESKDESSADEEEKKKMAKDTLSHADDSKDTKKAGGEKTIKEIVDTMNEEQKNAMYALIGAAVEAEDDEEDEEDDEMKHNLFDNDTNDYIEHSIDVQELIKDGKKYGSLKEAFLAHCEEMGTTEDELMHADGDTRYGIMPKMNGTTPVPGSLGIEALFPDAKNIYNTPEFVKRDTGWVDPVINGVSRSPFARFKTIFADITEDEARAKGYMKGNYKSSEVFSLLRREITPQTVYKKQQFDRDDLIDIVDFDILAWIKAEMRMMLDEEIARAILVGDGRDESSKDKIFETHVKSIYHDDDFYANKVRVDVAADATEEAIAKATIRAIIKARKNYKGSGNPVFYTTADVLTNMLLLEDGMGRVIYDTEEKLRTALRVSGIVEVEVMEGLSRNVTIGTTAVSLPLMGIVVNLTDYRVGADKGGNVSFFEDFDIDYNEQKFLIETRISGMLIKPHSAMVIELNNSGVVAQG